MYTVVFIVGVLLMVIAHLLNGSPRRSWGEVTYALSLTIGFVFVVVGGVNIFGDVIASFLWLVLDAIRGY